uniref:SCP domain-containing protein n=1 Tax=Mesocestoides corti TaxID=53468 RepID=A0A5K3FCC8_MESCO
MMLMNYSMEMEDLAVQFYADCRQPSNREPFEGTSEVLLYELPEMSQYFQESCKVNGDYYDFDKNKCSRPCLEYNVMVWATATQVGCALKACPKVPDVTKLINALVCIYKPGDKTLVGRPYESGESCSQCPDGYGCQRNQCFKNTPTTTSIAVTSTSIGTVLSTIESLIFERYYCTLSNKLYIYCVIRLTCQSRSVKPNKSRLQTCFRNLLKLR